MRWKQQWHSTAQGIQKHELSSFVQEAKHALETAVELKPGMGVAWRTLAKTQASLGDRLGTFFLMNVQHSQIRDRDSK